MDLMVREMWPTHSRPDMCKLLGVTEPSLYRRAKLLGLGIKQERASMGGKIATDNMSDMRSTKDFEKRYAEVAKRRGWVVRDDYRRAA